MFQRNKELFFDLTSFEMLFIKPDELPWFALVRMMELLSAKSGDLAKTVPSFPLPAWPDDVRVLDAHTHIKTPLVCIDINRPVYVFGGDGLKSDPDVHLRGPLVFGKNVTIRKGAFITGPGYIGDNVVIGHDVRFRQSIIRSNSEIVYGTRVSNALIGSGVTVGASAVLDDRPTGGSGLVSVSDGIGSRLRTHLAQLGLMAGDGSNIGGGATFGPGVVLPRGSIIGPGVCRMR